MNIKSFTFPRYRTVIFLVLALPVLYAISRYNYLLFHSLVDGLSIVIAACVFVITWNSRHLIDNDYFLYVGISFLFWAFLDFMHLLGNKNMGVFTAYGNLGPAFYIAGRYLLSISLIIAPFLINRKLNTTLLFAVYSLITLLVLLTILYWQIFPVCIVDGVGLTPFKVVSDYIICVILLGSIGVMIIKRRLFDSRVLWLIVTSTILSIATGLSFTLYTDPFGIMNMVGHLFQIASFYLIYRAFIETILSKPQDILYRKLKQNEESLAKSEEKFRKAFYSSLDSININRLADGVYVSINPGFTKIMGYTEEDIIGKSSIEYNIWEDIKDREKLLAGLKKDGELHNLEATFRTKGGDIRNGLMSASVIDLNGVPHIISITRDITDRRQAEVKLQESETRYKSFIAHSSEGIYRIEIVPPVPIDLSPTDIVEWINKNAFLAEVNESLSSMYGLRPDDMVGKHATDFAPDYGKRAALILEKSNYQVVNEETLDIDSAGNPLWLMENYHGEVHDRHLMRIWGVQSNITFRKQAEAEKAALEAQNRQLQKTESLALMAGAIAHHFNNQLGVVIGNLELAINSQPKDTQPSRSLTSAMDAAWKSADMSKLMLTYLGQTHNECEPLDLSYSCRKILPLIKSTLPGNVVIETDFPTPRPIIMANTGEMQQILTNLITNAREAIGTKNGIISLSVKTASSADIPTAHRHPIDWQPQDKTYACLEVTDNGCGIEDKDIEKLFDPFFSTKFTGRGMGLAVVQGLTNSHKGAITVESKPGRGSTFRLFFPVSEEALTQPQTPETDRGNIISSPSPKKMEEGGTVLVVEDEAMLREMAVAMLEMIGFTVLKAKDGIEALEVFGKHQSEIKFVLTDLTMPQMGGWETLTALRKIQPDIPVILSSGYDLAHVMEGDHPELPQAFLAKPYNLAALRNAITQTLERKKV